MNIVGLPLGHCFNFLNLYHPDDEEEGGRFLVDFQKKSVDHALQKRLEMRRLEEEEERKERNKLLEEQRQTEDRQMKEAEEERKELQEEVPKSNNPEEEWYVGSNIYQCTQIILVHSTV